MRTAVFSIARGVGKTGILLPVTEWERFREALRTLVVHYGATVVFEGLGSDNLGEESYTVVAARASGWAEALGHLKLDLGKLATQYGQEAIAVTLGDVMFIGPEGQEVEW